MKQQSGSGEEVSSFYAERYLSRITQDLERDEDDEIKDTAEYKRRAEMARNKLLAVAASSRAEREQKRKAERKTAIFRKKAEKAAEFLTLEEIDIVTKRDDPEKNEIYNRILYVKMREEYIVSVGKEAAGRCGLSGFVDWMESKLEREYESELLQGYMEAGIVTEDEVKRKFISLYQEGIKGSEEQITNAVSRFFELIKINELQRIIETAATPEVAERKLRQIAQEFRWKDVSKQPSTPSMTNEMRVALATIMKQYFRENGEELDYTSFIDFLEAYRIDVKNDMAEGLKQKIKFLNQLSMDVLMENIG